MVIVMIYSLQGNLIARKDSFVVLNVNGVCYKVFTSKKTFENLPALQQPLQIFSHLNVKEDALELYGFLNEGDLAFFEKLISVNGIGPKTALGVMGLAEVERLAAAINEGKADLLTRAAGVGKKTAERIILELRGKLASLSSGETIRSMESDLDIEEALVGLGYSQSQARVAIVGVDINIKGLENRLKAALKKVRK